MTKSKTILLVRHDDGSSWGFTYGANGHSDVEIKLISLEEVTDIDNSINELADIPEVVFAERKNIGDEWRIK